MAVGKLEWDESLSFNHIVDYQHKLLIIRTNHLYDCLVLGDPDSETKDLLEKIYREAALHFKTEEKIFEEKNFSQIKQHKKDHRNLEKILEKLLHEFDSSSSRIVKISIALDFKLHLIKHLLEKDEVFINELRDK